MGAAMTYNQVYGDELVLKTAAVTKLTRNVFLAGVIPYMAMLSQQERAKPKNPIDSNESSITTTAVPNETSVDNPNPPSSRNNPISSNKLETNSGFLASLKQHIPLFVYGFVGMSLLRSLGDTMLLNNLPALGFLEANQWRSLISLVGGELSGKWFLGTAMAAVGLSTNASALRGVGPKPFLLGFAGALCMGTIGCGSVLLLGSIGLM